MTTRMTTTSTPRNTLAQTRKRTIPRVTGGVRPHAHINQLVMGFRRSRVTIFLSKNAPIRSPGLQFGAFIPPSHRQTTP